MQAALISSFGRTTLGPGIVKIGQAFDNQLVLHDPQAALHHAAIVPSPQGYVLIDLKSARGTFVNEQLVLASGGQLLKVGDVIRIGGMTWTYEVAGAASHAGAPAGAPSSPVLAMPPQGLRRPDLQPTQPDCPAVSPPVSWTPPLAPPQTFARAGPQGTQPAVPPASPLAFRYGSAPPSVPERTSCCCWSGQPRGGRPQRAAEGRHRDRRDDTHICRQ
jgi:predicted component of type VI protein secretion system